MKVYKEALAAIDRGRAGLSVGLDIGLPRLMQYVPGVQQSSIYLMGGVTGCGKSALAAYSFVDCPYIDWKDHKKDKIKLKIFVWSLETSKHIWLVKAICRKIYHDTKGKVLVDVDYVLSRGKNRVSQEIYETVISYRKYYEEYEDIVEIYGPDTPTGIRNMVLKYFQDNGEDYWYPVKMKDDKGNEFTTMVHDRYNPGHDNMYTIIVVDHLNILKQENNLSKKQSIDKLSAHMVEIKNWYGASPVFVQQINRTIESSERQRANEVDIILSDFKESGDSQDAAHVIMAINYPYRWNEGQYKKYDTQALADRARFIHILKNRDGEPNSLSPCLFIGEVGYFEELPLPSEMTVSKYAEIQAIKKSYKV